MSDEQHSPESLWREQVASGTVGLAVGLALWGLHGAYRVDSGTFFTSFLLAAAVYTLAAPRTAVTFTGAMAVGPVPMALLTANQGDADGLWMLIVFAIPIFGLMMVAGVVILRRLTAGSLHVSRLSRALVKAHVGVTALAFGASIVIVLATLRAGEYSWADAEAVLDEAAIPLHMTKVELTRGANPKRYSIPTSLDLRLTSRESVQSDCIALQSMLETWADAGTVEWDVVTNADETWCSGSGNVEHDGETYEVRVERSTDLVGAQLIRIEVLTPYR